MATATQTRLGAATARFFRVLSDPTRVAILQLLAERPHTVSELVAATGVAQNRVSTHLACLRWCEFVSAERTGRNVTYSLVDPAVVGVINHGQELAERRLGHLASCTRIGPDWA